MADEVRCSDRAAWRAWLERNHERSEGLWLVHGDGLDYDAIVEEALCFGWIDSKAQQGRLWAAPRRKGSAWSPSNKRRVEALEAAELMTDAGRAAIERARADGSWTAYDAVEALEIPDDLGAALAGNADAARHFAAFPPGAKKAILWWVVSAKKPQTRQRRVEETVRLAAQNVRANQ